MGVQYQKPMVICHCKKIKKAHIRAFAPTHSQNFLYTKLKSETLLVQKIKKCFCLKKIFRKSP
jgi:hypothetical protein